MVIPIVNERLVSIDWEKIFCPLCGKRAESKSIMLHKKPLTEGQFGYTIYPVICDCGLVYLSPRWTEATYTEFYKQYYDPLYRLELKSDIGKDGVLRNMKTVQKRMLPYLAERPVVQNILDVGCGSGVGFEALRPVFKYAKFYGIEASQECIQTMKASSDVYLITDDINSPSIGMYAGFFDIIIMRHVMEHFLDPIQTLRKVSVLLSRHGIIYISMPDTMNPRTKLYDYKDWWKYYFRAVHPFYYNIDTASEMLLRSGLRLIFSFEEDHELWFIVSNNGADNYVKKYKNNDQENMLNVLLPK